LRGSTIGTNTLVRGYRWVWPVLALT